MTAASALHERALATTEPDACPVGSFTYRQSPEELRQAELVATALAAFRLDDGYLVKMAERVNHAEQHPVKRHYSSQAVADLKVFGWCAITQRPDI